MAGLPPALGMVSWGSVHASTWCPPCPGTGVWGLSPCLHMVPRLPPTGLRGPADCRHDHATPPPGGALQEAIDFINGIESSLDIPIDPLPAKAAK